MYKHEKEIIQAQLDKEEAVLKELEKEYQAALSQINEKIMMLQSDELTQSRIYQIQYQKALKGQVEAILEKLHADEYSTIQQYVSDSYTDAFVGTMYSFHKQKVPIILPIDKNAAVKAILTDSKISESMYEHLGINVKFMKKRIPQEITRGISAGLSYPEIIRNLKEATKAPLANAKNIVRTEGHRIQQASAEDARQGAKAKGADVVKQWDATLDGDTRPVHKALDGQIREPHEPFEYGNKKPMFPGDFGNPADDCNCRCVALTRARWALDEDELKTMQERAAFFGLDKSDSFEEFKEKYLKAADAQNEYLRNNMPKGYKETRKIGEPIKPEELSKIIENARLKGVQIGMDGKPTGGFDTYRGDVEVLKDAIEQVAIQLNSDLFRNSKAKKVILLYDNVLGYGGDNSMVDIGAFAITKGRTITLNKFMFDDSAYLAREYTEAVKAGYFAKGTDHRSIVAHEIGHIIDKNTPGLRSQVMAVIEDEAKKQGISQEEYIVKNVSMYGADLNDAGAYHELIAELNSMLTTGKDYGIIKALRKAGVF